MNPQLRVAVDVGCYRHRVAIGLSEGELLEEFEISHDGPGLTEFFVRVERQAQRWGRPVAVAMEGHNGYARPLDQRVLRHDYQLFNVNNLKLARYKEIFAAPSKSDAIDTRRMLELFTLQERLPTARGVLQEVAAVPLVNAQLKTLTRRRRQLVNERKQLGARVQADLQAVCPGLLAITGRLDNRWFLSLLTARADLRQLQRLRERTLRALRGVGRTYAATIRAWQREATFATSVDYVGPMIVQDARRLVELGTQIRALETQIEALAADSVLARRIDSIPGYGRISAAELAGEIGSVERFEQEASLAMYLGMAPVDASSGEQQGSRTPRHVNRRAKAAMMIAVMRHQTQVPESAAFYAKKRRHGKTHQQALRALGRHLVRVIWSMLHQDRDYRTAEPTPV
jgi:transposase